MAKRPRLINPRCHRPGNWNESQVTRVIQESGYVLGEYKHDGIRFHAFLQEGEVRVVTREGIEILSLEERKRYLRSLLETLPDGFCVDGEVVMPGIPFEDASGILRRYDPVTDEHTVLFMVWDTMPLGCLLGCVPNTEGYQDRKTRLRDALCSVPYPNEYVQYVGATRLYTLEECTQFFSQARRYKLEGAVVKDPAAVDRHGKVLGAWKMKPSDTADGRITGLVWGTPGLANEGKVIGFTVALEDGTECDATNISQAQMQEFTEAVIRHNGGPHVEFLRSHPDNNPFYDRYCHISYMEKTKAGSLRHPTFLNFRDLEYATGLKV